MRSSRNWTTQSGKSVRGIKCIDLTKDAIKILGFFV